MTGAPTQTCGRRGRYSVAKLMEQHGDAKLPELPYVLADCQKAKAANVYDRCKAVYGKDSRWSTSDNGPQQAHHRRRALRRQSYLRPSRRARTHLRYSVEYTTATCPFSPQQTYDQMVDMGQQYGIVVERIAPSDVIKTPDGNIQVNIRATLNGKAASATFFRQAHLRAVHHLEQDRAGTGRQRRHQLRTP
jgi:hypothetical protein